MTADEMAAAERSTIERGASGPDLMRRAAAAIADWIESHCAIVGAVTGLVGPGNNGGDTLVALGILGT
ncbi:MAG: bifunctional ADP-dependent NAD(P)H-hydrate dehydratase/NAD(P)H-hydrate epimerase, partial [Thermomicrobiales bacterium]|nr:bifunctional ADP-dependent NAD(P)H-hydrate dehydratase/NAD(P)H-hydrate epimerase [Thermomicrobiales bacterium]